MQTNPPKNHLFALRFRVLMAFFLLTAVVSCDPINPEPEGEQEWLLPNNRTGYVVTSITWYESPTNHPEYKFTYRKVK